MQVLAMDFNRLNQASLKIALLCIQRFNPLACINQTVIWNMLKPLLGKYRTTCYTWVLWFLILKLYGICSQCFQLLITLFGIIANACSKTWLWLLNHFIDQFIKFMEILFIEQCFWLIQSYICRNSEKKQFIANFYYTTTIMRIIYNTRLAHVYLNWRILQWNIRISVDVWFLTFHSVNERLLCFKIESPFTYDDKSNVLLNSFFIPSQAYI